MYLGARQSEVGRWQVLLLLYQKGSSVVFGFDMQLPLFKFLIPLDRFYELIRAEFQHYSVLFGVTCNVHSETWDRSLNTVSLYLLVIGIIFHYGIIRESYGELSTPVSLNNGFLGGIEYKVTDKFGMFAESC